MPLPDSRPLTLASVNRLSRAEFAAALGGVFEHSQWVAEAAWPAAPFADKCRAALVGSHRVVQFRFAEFGLIVDATVIMVENIFRHLSEGEQHHEYAPTGLAARAGLTGKLRTILRSANEVNQAIFFAAGIIITGFVPLFTLNGVEGHIFGPMATTYAYAIAGAS
jgi:hypothetical protein